MVCVWGVGIYLCLFSPGWDWYPATLGGASTLPSLLGSPGICPGEDVRHPSLKSTDGSRPFGEDGGSVVDGASHSRFDSPVSCCDVSRVHGLHTALHREKLGSEEDGRILTRHAALVPSPQTGPTDLGVICKELVLK
jgi:hypothetical protein